MSLPARLLGANPSIQVSSLLSGTLTTPSAKGARVPEFSDYADSYELINTYYASTTADTVTFSSIPSTYKAIEIRIYGGGISGSASSLKMSVNNDTTSTNYYITRWNYTTNTSSPYIQGVDATVIDDGMDDVTNQYSSWHGLIVGYAETTGRKSAFVQNGAIRSNSLSSQVINSSSWTWESSAAISTITFSHNNGANRFRVGTRFSIYGLK